MADRVCLNCLRPERDGAVFTAKGHSKKRSNCDACHSAFGQLRPTDRTKRYLLKPVQPVETYTENGLTVHKLPPQDADGCNTPMTRIAVSWINW